MQSYLDIQTIPNFVLISSQKLDTKMHVLGKLSHKKVYTMNSLYKQVQEDF